LSLTRSSLYLKVKNRTAAMRDYEEELIENQFEEYEDDDGWDDAMEL
jgi:hypothetical protein